jgi:isopentenyl phosphate kinase
MERLTIIKLGGSVITDKSKPFYAKERTIGRLGREILQVTKRYKGCLIIGHGSGSFGHVVASRYKTHKGLINRDSKKGMVLTSDAAIQINRIVMKNLIKVGLLVKSFSPTSFIVAKGGRFYKVFSDPIHNVLLTGVTPVIYGDVIGDIKMGFCIFSAEMIIHALIKALRKNYEIERIIYCSNTNGVYDREGNAVPKITSKNINKLRDEIGYAEGADVTGGMLHKVEESLKLAQSFNIRTMIINGMTRGSLRRACTGDNFEGTLISS